MAKITLLCSPTSKFQAVTRKKKTSIDPFIKRTTQKCNTQLWIFKSFEVVPECLILRCVMWLYPQSVVIL